MSFYEGYVIFSKILTVKEHVRYNVKLYKENRMESEPESLANLSQSDARTLRY